MNIVYYSIHFRRNYGSYKKLDIKKSANIYGTSPKLIKIAAEKIINHLTLIFKCSIEQGIFPEKLKSA